MLGVATSITWRFSFKTFQLSPKWLVSRCCGAKMLDLVPIWLASIWCGVNISHLGSTRFSARNSPASGRTLLTLRTLGLPFDRSNYIQPLTSKSLSSCKAPQSSSPREHRHFILSLPILLCSSPEKKQSCTLGRAGFWRLSLSHSNRIFIL